MITVRKVLKEIGCPVLNLYNGKGYWYFVYDDTARGVYETKSVYVMRLNELALAQWIEAGRGFIAEL